MTVKELIEKLEQFDQTMEVHFSYNYGDHARTIVCPPVTHVGEDGITYSNYHNMPTLDEASDRIVVILE